LNKITFVARREYRCSQQLRLFIRAGRLLLSLFAKASIRSLARTSSLSSSARRSRVVPKSLTEAEALSAGEERGQRAASAARCRNRRIRFSLQDHPASASVLITGEGCPINKRAWSLLRLRSNYRRWRLKFRCNSICNENLLRATQPIGVGIVLEIILFQTPEA